MLPDKIDLLSLKEEDARNAASAIIREAQQDRATRGEDYHKNWDMYQNRHESYFKRRLNEEDNIFLYRKTNAIKSNLCSFTVDLSAKYLYGKASKIVRVFSKKNQETDERMRKLVSNFHIESLLLHAAKRSSIYGEGILRLVPVDKETKQQVVGKTNENTYPHPILMDPRNTFVKLNRWGRIIAVFAQYVVNDYTNQTKKAIIELVVDDSRWLWESKSTIDVLNPTGLLQTNPNLIFSGAEFLGVESNPFKLCDEFVYLPNNEDRKSDLHDIIDLNIALDEALTDKQHFFQKHGWPQLVSEVDLKNVAHTPNRIWEITPDVDDKKKVLDRLGFLTWDGKMEDHAKFIKNLEKNIMVLSNTAAISTGDLEAIGQLRSGAALITAHSVAIHKTEGKQIVWEKNEKELCKALSNLDAYFHGEPVEGRYPDLEFRIRFPKDFVPGSEMERIQIQQMQVISHTKPLIDVIEEEYGNLGREELEEKRTQILKDAEDIIDSTRKFISVKEGEEGASGKSGTPMEKSREQKTEAS